MHASVQDCLRLLLSVQWSGAETQLREIPDNLVSSNCMDLYMGPK